MWGPGGGAPRSSGVLGIKITSDEHPGASLWALGEITFYCCFLKGNTKFWYGGNEFGSNERIIMRSYNIQ